MEKIAKYDKNMNAIAVTEGTMNYYNPLDNDSFTIEGLPFVKENNNYFRLPPKYINNISEAVGWLAKQPSGGQIRFKTNSRKISVKIKNAGDYQMCHMAATGQQGVDIYYKKGKKFQFYTVSKFPEPSIEFECEIFSADTKKEREFLINLPLYEQLDSILIGIEKGSTIKKCRKRTRQGKVVVYGTSITQGGCASHPGMSFTNILSRWLDIEFVNLGFSGSGMGEPIIGDLLSDISDTKMYILDYEANGGCTDSLENHMNEIIDKIRATHPDTPIVIKTKEPFSIDAFNQKGINRRQYLYNFQKSIVETRSTTDKNIYFIDGSKAYGKNDTEGMSVDGIHPTDLGFYYISKYLYPQLKKILDYENNK